MFKNIATLLFLSFLFSCKSSQGLRKIESSELVKSFHYPLEEKRVSIHRGGGFEANWPENCLEGFHHYQDKIPNALIECDVRLSKDSVQLLLHDAFMERTTNFKGHVNEKTFAQLQSARLIDLNRNQTAYQIPSLAETLKTMPKNAIYTLDVKRETPFKLVTDLVRKYKKEDQCIIITYSADQAKLVYDLAPELMISVSIFQISDYERLHNLGIPDANMIAFIGSQRPKKDFIDLMHKKGILCILGTIGNLDQKAAAKSDALYGEFADLGVDIFATDRPFEVNQILKIKH